MPRTTLLAIWIIGSIARIANGQAADCTLPANATVSGVINAASSQAAISPNAMISIFGAGFAPPGSSNSAVAGDFVDGKFPTELRCVGVEIGGQRAPVTFVGSNQINVQVPAFSQTGAMNLTVVLNPGRANEARSAPFSLSLRSYGPALFTLDGHSVAARHDTFEPLADPAAVSGGRPAKPGDWIILYGTGFGPTQPVYQAGELVKGPAPLRDPFTITVGGAALRSDDILYAGLAPGSISGLYQFNVRIPDNASAGDVLVGVTVSNVPSPNGATIPVRQQRLIHVPGDFATIQAAVNAALFGDAIEVGPGSYPENVTITKSGIRLLGPAGQQRAVIDGTGLMGVGILVKGTAQLPVTGVEIAGFIVQNCVTGIRLENTALSLVHLNETRLNVSKVPPWTVVDADGILLINSSFNHIRQNYSHNNGHDTIILAGGNVGNVIQGNVVDHNGFDTGVPWAGPWQTHGGCGVLLGSGGNTNNYILENQITGGDWGILITGANTTGNVVAGNDIHSNNRAGVAFGAGVTANLVMNNNATGNGLGSLTPSLGFDLFSSDLPATGNTWVGNKGKANF
jgi:uncharacterized protein (TIGR03437 family)